MTTEHDATSPRTLKILLVGEGNLSFSHALVKRLSASRYFSRWREHGPRSDDAATVPVGAAVSRPRCSVLATTFDDEEEQVAKYPEAAPFLAYVASKSRVMVRYQGRVNAADLEATLAAGDSAVFDPALVVFNNPHIGFEDLYRQGSLISHFFAAVREMPRAGAGAGAGFERQVVMSLCDQQPWRWGMLDAAARNGFTCVAAVPLFTDDFPEYENKRHQSDAKFPYKVMVQYYFVETAAHPQLLADLTAAVADWPLENGAANTPQTTDTSAWLRLAGANATAAATASGEAVCDTAALLPAHHQELARCCAQTSGSDGAAAVAAAAPYSMAGLELRACLPLLHPRLFYASGERLFTGTTAEETDPAAGGGPLTRSMFSPYADLGALPRLYQLQRAVEEAVLRGAPAEKEGSAPVVATPQPAIPGTLNADVLGRPLTQRESLKLARYLEKHRAGVTQVSQKKKKSVKEGHATPTALVCPYCTGDREQRLFRSQSGYDSHVLVKHSGVDQLHPNMHARVHTQIIRPDGDDAHQQLEGLVKSHLTLADDPAAEGRYCAVCDLLFRDSAAYQEHLAFLSPRTATFVCHDCDEPREFSDERALQQHRIQKHAA